MNKTKNPYELVYYNASWSQAKTQKNNNNYWDWEIKYNGFIPENTTKEGLERIKAKIKL